MFESATSTLEYRPAFGRRVPAAAPARDTFWVSDLPRRSVDSITAELRQRILQASARPRPAFARSLAR
jgi:hypothetical protein